MRNAEVEYERNKILFNKEIISRQSFDNIELSYNQAKQNVENAKSDLEIIQLGSTGVLKLRILILELSFKELF